MTENLISLTQTKAFRGHRIGSLHMKLCMISSPLRKHCAMLQNPGRMCVFPSVNDGQALLYHPQVQSLRSEPQVASVNRT